MGPLKHGDFFFLSGRLRAQHIVQHDAATFYAKAVSSSAQHFILAVNKVTNLGVCESRELLKSRSWQSYLTKCVIKGGSAIRTNKQ